MNKKILVIGAHPDDETLGAGATIAKHAEQGDEVHVVIVGDGVSARYDEYTEEVAKKVQAIKDHAMDAAKILGIKSFEVIGKRGLIFDQTPLIDFVKLIMKYIEKIKPDIIYTHGSAELNIDHSILHRATVTACRPVWEHRPTEILCYEVPSSTEWVAPHPANAFIPSVYVNVEKTLYKKIEAMKAYKDELREFPFPRSVEYLEVLAKKRGAEVGIKAAEAFMPVRIVR
ncbi:MAG: PIG-L deacetylase family protein [Nanoarchaeota archaeon]